MKIRTCLILASFVFALPAVADFRYQSELTVSGYRGSETLEGFPVLVRLSPSTVSGFDYALCRADGRDLQFTSTDGATVYPHDVETWDPHGESLVWVRLPSLSGTSTKFLLTFGDPAYATENSPRSTWITTDTTGYRGVWHFAEETADGRISAADSAKYDANYVLDAVPKADKEGTDDFRDEMISIPGRIGNGRYSHHNRPFYDKSWFEVPGFAGSGYVNGGKFTVSTWLKATRRNGYDALIGQLSGGLWDAHDGWELMWYQDDTTLKCWGNDGSVDATVPNFTNGWTHLAVVYDDTTISVYTNGVLSKSGTVAAAAADNGQTLKIGLLPTGAQPYFGAYDELRIFAGVPTADRIQAEYDATSAGFVTAGAVVPCGANRLYVTGDPECASGNLPAYGVYENLADGATVVSTAPEGAFVYADGLEATVSGWTLYDIAADGTVSEVTHGEGTSYTYTHVAGKTRKLVWSFTLTPKFIYEAEVTVSGYRGTETLYGFPVLVRISPATVSGFAYNLCQSNGADIQFLSTDGKTVYPHELERWDVNGTSFVWVRVPELSGTETKMLFRFGCATLTPTAAAKKTWASSADGYYAGVWHFGETIDAASAGATVSADSAKHSDALNLDGIATNSQKLAANIQQMTSAAGKVGLARVNSVDKENNYLSIPSYDDFSLGSNFTFTGWFRFTDQKDSNSTRLFGRSFQEWNADGAWCASLYNSTKNVNFYVGTSASSGFVGPDVTPHEWIHYAVSFSGYALTFYTNGVPCGSKTLIQAPGENGKPLALGTPMGKWRFYGLYDEVRLLSRPATPDWIRAEFDTADDEDFVTIGAAHTIADDSLFITSSTENFGSVTPGYGLYEGTLAGGTQIACSAGEEVVDVSDVVKVQIRGWKLYEYDEDGQKPSEPYDSASTNALTYVHMAGKTRELEWNVVRMRPLVLSATRGATFLINGEAGVSGTNWVDEGTVTLQVAATSGTAGSDWVFNGWKVNGAIVETEAELEITHTGPIAIEANYTSLLHVASDGDDSNPGTEALPLKTLTAALALAHEPDEIRVKGGLYSENVTAKDVVGVTVRGGYDANWSRDPMGTPSVFKAATATQPVMRFVSCSTNTVSGLVLTGGSVGFWMGRISGNRLDQLIITNNTSSGIYYEHDLSSVNKTTFAVTSSYIADNGRYGLEQKHNDWGTEAAKPLYIQNCTIVSNALGGIYVQLHNASVINSIICGNGDADITKRMIYYNYGKTSIYSSCIGLFVWPEDNQQSSEDSAVKAGKGALYFCPGIMRGDPRLAADGSLRADSRLIARGEDLAEAEYPVTEDVYGRSWNGVYDIGAFKSSAPIVHGTTYAQTYVATDGDDDAEGDAPGRALRTVSEGVLRTAPGGTCHIGEGVYELSSAISTAGLTLAGAGRDKTFLKPSGTNDAVLSVAAHDITIRDLALVGGAVGVVIESEDFASNTIFRSCLVESNVWGAVQQSSGETSRKIRGLWIDQSIFRNNHRVGIYVEKTNLDTYLTSSLVDGCGCSSNGIYAISSRVFMYNDTILSCAHYGFYHYAAWGNSKESRCYNVVFAGNGIGWTLKNDWAVAGRNCLFDNVVDTDFKNPTYDPADPGFIFADAMLEMEGRRRGRPTAESPAAGGGVVVSELGAAVPVTTDVNGSPYRVRAWDIGAFARPHPAFLLIVR